MTKAPPINYLQRIRHYYQTLGYGAHYEWARHDEVAFQGLTKPLQQCNVGLITTAAPVIAEAGDQGPGAPYNSAAKFYSVYAMPAHGNVDVRISHVGYDRKHTTAEDMGCWLPLAQLHQAALEHRIGKVSDNLYGLPTNRSQVTTMERDCPALLQLLKSDKVDIAVLVANCPVCHQCCSMAANFLEQHGIPTVVMACAKDIVEYVGVPRLLFSDFPLGNAAGKPNDIDSQRLTLLLALDLFESAVEERTTVQSPIEWDADHRWKEDFYNVEKLSATELETLRKEFDQQKQIAKQKRQQEGLAVKN